MPPAGDDDDYRSINVLFLKTHGTAVSCYTGEEERKQQTISKALRAC